MNRKYYLLILAIITISISLYFVKNKINEKDIQEEINEIDVQEDIEDINEIDVQEDTCQMKFNQRNLSAKGMTWKVSLNNSELDIVKVDCLGCNPYKGDTYCNSSLPILCIKKMNYDKPNYQIPSSCSGVMPCSFYNGWSGGILNLTTQNYPGCLLIKQEIANTFCIKEFGQGYQIAEHHDGNGGWGFYGKGQINYSGRFWTNINDQQGNCWDQLEEL